MIAALTLVLIGIVIGFVLACTAVVVVLRVLDLLDRIAQSHWIGI